MQVEVKNGLPAMGIGVDNEPVSIPRNSFPRGNQPGGCKEAPDQLLIPVSQQVDRFDMPVRDDQDVNRRGGMHVTKSGRLPVAEDDCTRAFTGNDPAKNAVPHLLALYGVGMGP
jgi:hypothetical protein